jgi:5-methylcytosine-specific restriction enzyme B
MNYKLFEKVIENNNENIIGVKINSRPEYKEDFKKLLIDFNEFTKLICPDNLETKNISNRWQNSGSYKKYFWNQYGIINNENIDEKGYSVWLGISYDGIKIQCGTTQDYDGNRQNENKNIFKYINISLKEIFNTQGIYDNEIITKFEKNEYLDISYDKHAALFYQYKGNDEKEDIKYFKIVLFFLAEQLKIYLKSKKNISPKNFENDFKEYWFNDNILQVNGSRYADGTKTSYFRELQRLTSQIDKNIFEIDNLEELNYILERLENGNLKEYNRRNSNTDPSNGLKQYITFIESRVKEINNIKRSPIMNIKNIILYGAPGVGKTHNYKKLISLIEQGKSQSEIFESIQSNTEFITEDESFQTIKREKRIEFITFHQSFSYEDFIEGFRPNKDGKIELENGIFKKNVDKITWFKSFTDFFKYKIESFGFNDDGYFNLSKVIELNPKNELKIRKMSDDLYFYSYKNAKDDIDFNLLEELLENNSFSFDEISNYIKLRQNSYFSKDNFQEYVESYEYITRYTKSQFKIYKDIKTQLRKNRYLVIDEINRGNISKIFGELITIIEESKRDTYEVTLPYSKLKFSVPSNLYIIGTMNTTDKSIALIDVALRRRFTFIKMEPNSNLVLPRFKKDFEKLNKLITEHIGEDHQIGHSYFMNIDESDLEFVKKYKIKPLLEEYYYGDERISEALNILGL